MNKPVPRNTTISPATVIFSFAKQKVTLRDWLAFRRSTGNADNINSGTSQQQLMDYYRDLVAAEYYRNHLEEYNKDFAFQVKEFKDGNLLFEVMQRKVWDKASTDSAGLKKYYNAHKDKYWWENSASAILLTAMHDTIAANLKTKIQSNYRDWRNIVDAYNGNVIADSGRFELSQLPASPGATLAAGSITPYLRNETDSSVTFAYIIKLFPQKEQRNFEDARGYVINDYQQYLETAWIAELRKKYPVVVNQTVFKSLTTK
jgi:peptidyl-prolyl cis-trans isomerase SurA